MDTMLMLRNYLDKLTPSEFHCFLVGGHATVAGFVFGLFVLFGVSRFDKMINNIFDYFYFEYLVVSILGLPCTLF